MPHQRSTTPASNAATLERQSTPGQALPCAAPIKTPEAILNKINADVVKILATADMKERLAGLGVTPEGGTRAQFTAFVRSEIAKWSKLIKDASIKAD